MDIWWTVTTGWTYNWERSSAPQGWVPSESMDPAQSLELIWWMWLWQRLNRILCRTAFTVSPFNVQFRWVLGREEIFIFTGTVVCKMRRKAGVTLVEQGCRNHLKIHLHVIMSATLSRNSRCYYFHDDGNNSAIHTLSMWLLCCSPVHQVGEPLAFWGVKKVSWLEWFPAKIIHIYVVLRRNRVLIMFISGSSHLWAPLCEWLCRVIVAMLNAGWRQILEDARMLHTWQYYQIPEDSGWGRTFHVYCSPSLGPSLRLITWVEEPINSRSLKVYKMAADMCFVPRSIDWIPFCCLGDRHGEGGDICTQRKRAWRRWGSQWSMLVGDGGKFCVITMMEKDWQLLSVGSGWRL